MDLIPYLSHSSWHQLGNSILGHWNTNVCVQRPWKIPQKYKHISILQTQDYCFFFSILQDIGVVLQYFSHNPIMKKRTPTTRNVKVQKKHGLGSKKIRNCCFPFHQSHLGAFVATWIHGTLGCWTGMWFLGFPLRGSIGKRGASGIEKGVLAWNIFHGPSSWEEREMEFPLDS